MLDDDYCDIYISIFFKVYFGVPKVCMLISNIIINIYILRTSKNLFNLINCNNIIIN